MTAPPFSTEVHKRHTPTNTVGLGPEDEIDSYQSAITC